MECDYRGKGKGKRTILRYFIFLDRSFSLRSFRLANNLLRNHLYAQPFKLRRGYVNFIALRKYNFLDSFFCCSAYKIYAVTILNIIPLTERTFQSRMLTFLRKNSSVSSFLWPAIGLHGVQSFFYECSFVLKDSLIYFATAGKGNRTGMYAGIFVS